VVLERKIVKPEPLVKDPIGARAADAKDKKVYDFKQHHMKPESTGGGPAPGEGLKVKPRVAVSRFGDIKSLSTNPFSAFVGDTVIDRQTNTLIRKNWDKEAYEGFTDDITTALIELDQFIVLERGEINKILREQGFQTTGFTEKLPNKDLGVLTGVQYIVTGTAGETEDGKVAVNLRVYDIYRGTIVGAKRITADNQWHAVQQAVAHISEKIVPEDFVLKVSRVDGPTVYLNGGKNIGVKGGERYEIYSVRNKIVDPDTNEVLGVQQDKVALVLVGGVQEKMATGTVLEQTSPIKAGDIAKPHRGVYFAGKTAKE